jgi:hypothetical protein
MADHCLPPVRVRSRRRISSLAITCVDTFGPFAATISSMTGRSVSANATASAALASDCALRPPKTLPRSRAWS